MATLNEKQLLAKKAEIQEAKTLLSELKGEEKALLKQLKDDWECDSLAEAKKKIRQMESESEILTQEIEEKTKVLEKKYLENEA
jgi:hypothetical protein